MNRRAKRLTTAGIAAGCLSAIAVGSAIFHPFHGLEYTGGTLNTLTARTPEYAHWAETNDHLALIGLVLVLIATALQVVAVLVDD
jgi:hypothetical protein